MPNSQQASGATSPPAHAVEAAQVVEQLGVDRQRGLSSAQVTERLSTFGHNELQKARPTPKWKNFLAQFTSLVIWILIAAALIAGLMGEWTDTAAILAIVVLNGVLGFVQEEKAKRALDALQKLSAPVAKVTRDGTLQSVAASELVPGDLLLLEAGDHVPADARLVESFVLAVGESALTGESVPVEKNAAQVFNGAIPLGDRRNMVYLGTIVATGKGTAVVTATGMRTELGKIAGLLERRPHTPTPLQRRLEELGRLLIVVCLTLVAIIFVTYLVRGRPIIDVFLMSISLAVAAVPEGLPAVVTIALALGLQRMARRNALVRKLPSVETLGSVTVICTDKTGTLTRNEMTVRRAMVGEEQYSVTGAGYDPQGDFVPLEQPSSDSVSDSKRAEIRFALTIAARCNSAQMKQQDGGGVWQVIGDPTEGALLVAAAKAGVPAREKEQVILEMPFDSQRKAMSVVWRNDTQIIMYTKGAPEVIFAACTHERRRGRIEPLTDDRRKQLAELSAQWASETLRVLALAYREFPAEGNNAYEERQLTLAALVGMLDPPREEAKQAIAHCREAYIRPVMITGDHPATALAIARELKLATESETLLSGQELDQLSADDLAAKVDQVSVYARVSAEHKLRVIEAWKKHGQVVAMTGDGVNDAPAVQAADIGIAMGITGTDVTKEASDMVLTDDNFVSIVNAVEEGRAIFDNIQKFVHYLLSCNAGEILFMFAAALVGWPLPLTALQILWINLVTDGLPALALAMEPPEADIMRRPPRPPREPVITLNRGLLILFHGSLVAAATLIGFWLIYQGNPSRENTARAASFCILALAQLAYSFSCRSQNSTLPQLGFFTNLPLCGSIFLSGMLQLGVVTIPWARHLFDVEEQTAIPWGLVLVLSLAPVTIVEVIKLVRAAFARDPRNRTHVR